MNPRGGAPGGAAPRGRLLAFGGLLLLTLALVLMGCESIDFESTELPEDTIPRIDMDVSGALAEAERAVEEKRYNDAYILLGRVLRQDPTNQKANLIFAELNLMSGNIKPAAAAFIQLEDVPEYETVALQGVGITALLEGELEIAEKALLKAVEKDPSLGRAWNALGVYYDSQGDWKSSEEAYRKALGTDPKSSMFHNNYGYSLLVQGRFSEAQEHFTRALKLDPDYVVARFNLRVSLAWQGHYREAVYGADPADAPTVYNNVGYVAMLRGDYQVAEGYLASAMEASPSFNETAWKNLQYLKYLRGK